MYVCLVVRFGGMIKYIFYGRRKIIRLVFMHRKLVPAKRSICTLVFVQRTRNNVRMFTCARYNNIHLWGNYGVTATLKIQRSLVRRRKRVQCVYGLPPAGRTNDCLRNNTKLVSIVIKYRVRIMRENILNPI